MQRREWHLMIKKRVVVLEVKGWMFCSKLAEQVVHTSKQYQVVSHGLQKEADLRLCVCISPCNVIPSTFPIHYIHSITHLVFPHTILINKHFPVPFFTQSFSKKILL